MKRSVHTGGAAAALLALLTACNASPNPGTSTTTTGPPTKTFTTTVSPATATGDPGPDLRSLIPTPAGTARTDGPDPLPDNGIHLHFLVNGSPTDVVNAYKTALEAARWSVTVVSSGGDAQGGGATYTATNGPDYGVFTGGGSGASADVDACAWPTRPTNTGCGHSR